ncbi:hypothetical protein CRUP_022053 [Coryphaenoides rupestris]|nr:hypothetical protein CRUP_022053 [Coryphaenoides rupestris]
MNRWVAITGGTKPTRVKRFKLQKKPEQHDENDPQAYRGLPVPDKASSDFTRDEVDRFHDEKIAKLLASGAEMDSDHEDGDDEEEVMALDDSESEEEEEYEDEKEVEEVEEEEEGSGMESDLEARRDEDLPSDMAWGNRKKLFYDSDYVAAKGKTQEEVEAEDKEEEEEAKNIQRRLAANLSEEDYDLNLFQEFATEKDEKSAENEQKIVKDLDQMSQKEKLKLLKKESPEMLELIQDFKAKLAELKDELQPLVEMVKDGRIPPGKLINELGAVDARLGPQVRRLLAGGLGAEVPRKPSSKKGKAPVEAVGEASEEGPDLDDEEQAALNFYKEVQERLRLKKKRKNADPYVEMEENGVAEEEAVDGDMAKNKGLTPKRKKINRNPRVKHREKFRRAKIKRKGQVREVRREETRYSGEHSGIRSGLKKSIKLA